MIHSGTKTISTGSFFGYFWHPSTDLSLLAPKQLWLAPKSILGHLFLYTWYNKVLTEIRYQDWESRSRLGLQIETDIETEIETKTWDQDLRPRLETRGDWGSSLKPELETRPWLIEWMFCEWHLIKSHDFFWSKDLLIFYDLIFKYNRHLFVCIIVLKEMGVWTTCKQYKNDSWTFPM